MDVEGYFGEVGELDMCGQDPLAGEIRFGERTPGFGEYSGEAGELDTYGKDPVAGEIGFEV